ncbi:MAG: type IV pili methyl-accepting chemotaxis transducer N-terminal domain-containing protein [Pseudomonadota bacterium]
MSFRIACAMGLAFAMGAPAGPGMGPISVVSIGPAFAEDVADGKRRVNLAGRQRMLTQRMTKATCFVALGVERDHHRKMLQTARDDFDRALQALRFGDEGLGVYGEESAARVLRGLGKVEKGWSDFDRNVSSALAKGEVGEDVEERLYSTNLPLLKDMNDTVSMIDQAHADPNDMLLASAVAINIAGRQRMLTQKMAKELCQIQRGWRTEETRKALETTMALFEGSHAALRDGMPAAGVVPPPTEGIAASLKELEALWLTIRPTVAKAMNGDAIDDEELSVFAFSIDRLLRDMHAIVGLYEKA